MSCEESYFTFLFLYFWKESYLFLKITREKQNKNILHCLKSHGGIGKTIQIKSFPRISFKKYKGTCCKLLGSNSQILIIYLSIYTEILLMITLFTVHLLNILKKVCSLRAHEIVTVLFFFKKEEHYTNDLPNKS